MNPKQITCREFNDCIFDHVEQSLTSEQTVLFERHMRVCPLCRNFLKTCIATHKAKDHIFPYENIDVADEVPQDLTDTILDVRRAKHE